MSLCKWMLAAVLVIGYCGCDTQASGEGVDGDCNFACPLPSRYALAGTSAVPSFPTWRVVLYTMHTME